MKKNILKTVICLFFAAVLVLLDQLSKAWAVNELKNAADLIVIPGVFQLHYLENTGMAFGLMENQQIFFYIMTAIILAAVLTVLYKTPWNKRFAVLNVILTFVIAGAIGNLIDRASQQYVVDFLYFSLIDFPVFNVADCYITVSCILLLILLFFVYKDDELKETYTFGKKEQDGTATD